MAKCLPSNTVCISKAEVRCLQLGKLVRDHNVWAKGDARVETNLVESSAQIPERFGD